MTRVEQLQQATCAEEVDEILAKDSSFTLIGTNPQGEKIRMMMFQDGSGLIAEYFDDVVLAVPLTNVELLYNPESRMLVADDSLN